MKVVWNLGQITVNHVVDNIDRKLPHTTIATTMEIWLAKACCVIPWGVELFCIDY